MARGRRRRAVVPKNLSDNDSYSLRNRRSSMRVNLSYMSNLSDSGNSSLKKTITESDETVSEKSIRTIEKPKTKASNVNNDTVTPTSVSNITVINANKRHLCENEEAETDGDLLAVIKEKEQQLNRSCLQLKDAIISKTQALFDRETELAIKTSEVLATTFNSPNSNINEISDQTPPRSPSIRINIGKNDQIIMSGDGKKRNPVQVNSMFKDCVPQEQCDGFREEDDENDMDCSQSIASTPKKSRIEYSVDGKGSKTDEIILKIPVARLFADDNDPNNSMSKVNQACIANNQQNIVGNDNETVANNVPNTSNEQNYIISPILSQGNRRARLRLSLKKKLTENSSRSSNITTESFINKLPLTCSSFVEKLEEVKNKSSVNDDKTVDLSSKNEASNNCRTINLDDNENNSKTINVETLNGTSCMEITAIPTQMPIVRRSLEFQDIIRKSLNLDSVCSEYKNSQKFNVSTQNRVPPNTENHENISKEISQSTRTTRSSNIYQEDCSANTVRTSLNVNTSTDQMSLADYVQKENKRPNNIEEVVNKRNTNQTNENESTVNSCQNHIIHHSKTSSTLNNIDKEKDNNGPISFQSINDYQEKGINKSKAVVLNCDDNQEKENNKTMSRQPSTSTVRSSMQVNTSLDSARKSPIEKNVLDFNKILSMVEETTCNGNQTKTSVYTSNDQSSNSDSELENVSLMERIRNISVARKNGVNQEPNPTIVNRKRKSAEIENENIKLIEKKVSKSKSVKLNTSRKIEENENIEIPDSQKFPEIENNKSSTRRKSTEYRKSSVSARKSTDIQNTSSTAETSVIEATPYPASRSVLFKTMIKNNIDMNTLDPRRFVDLSDADDEELNEEYQTIVQKKIDSPVKKYQSVYARKKTPSPNLMDTVILNSSDESSNESDKEKDPILIDESLNETEKPNKSKNHQESGEDETNKKAVPKRKLYPLRDNSQLISFSPGELQELPKVAEPKTVVKKRKRKVIQKKKQENKIVTRELPEVDHESEPLENEILPKTEKKKRKPRKIISKKIVVKKVMNLSILDKMMDNKEVLPPQRLSERNSLTEFDLRRLKCRRNENINKKSKIIIVVTGLPKEDRDLIKSVVKTLGSANLEVNVTPRTTHVISSGVRTINLLKGILRGCWLLSMEWALKSLENEKWLDPSPYEMSHFSKAVQENRRDRQLFGKAYVPELFVTCGFIYVENGTIPPTSTLKELIKIAGGRITEEPSRAEIFIGTDGLKEIWVLDSITTGEVQPTDQYKRN